MDTMEQRTAKPVGRERNPWYWIQAMPWVALVAVSLVAVASVYDLSSDRHWTLLALMGLACAMVVWFVRAFTYASAADGAPANGARDAIFQRQIFIYAYAFTFISFVVVLVPARNLLDPSNAARSPLTMFYGCYKYAADAHEEGPIPRCDGTGAGADADADANSYALLLAVGGVAAQTVKDGKDEPYYRVRGGLVMPLYVVIIALLGGAISLSRRIPEIQKRANPSYPGTGTQTRLLPYEAREQVVFQIMQLVSAPFIAICSFHIVHPTGTASAVALAFASGFASEAILLLIRGAVEKIKPDTPQTVASEVAKLSGIVVDDSGKPAPDARVVVSTATDASGQGLESTSGANGRFVFAAVPKDEQQLVATKGDLEGRKVVDVTAQTPPVTIAMEKKQDRPE